MDPKLKTPKLVRRVPREPKLEELAWPGLKAKDHLSRVITRAVKEARKERFRLLWAEWQIAQVLNRVPPRTALTIFFREMRRRGRRIPRIAYNLIELF